MADSSIYSNSLSLSESLSLTSDTHNKQAQLYNHQHANDVERLPRVIADADNISLDISYDASNVISGRKQLISTNNNTQMISRDDLLPQFKTFNDICPGNGTFNDICPVNGNKNDIYSRTDQSESEMIRKDIEIYPTYIPDIKQQTSDNLPRYNDAVCYDQSVMPSVITPLEITSLTRAVYLADNNNQRNMASEETRQSTNASQENYRHSRNTSNENQRHSRNSSNENNRHSRHSSNENNRHSRNPSNENTRHSRSTSIDNNRHSRHTSDEYSRHTSDEYERNPHFHRTQSEENIRYGAHAHTTGVMHRSPPNDGVMHRSLPNDGPPQIFTVDSFVRRPDVFSTEKELQLYYQEILRQRTIPTDQTGNSSTSFSTEQNINGIHPPATDNAVVNVRGYNQNYKISMSDIPSPKSIYTARHALWNKDCCPSRRAAPVILAPTASRFTTAAKTSPLAVTSANGMTRSTLPSPSSNQGSPPSKGAQTFVADYLRNQPSEYGRVPRQLDCADADDLQPSYQKENVEIDQDIMRKMTKKYCEPRFTNGARKDPPPYSSSHTTLMNSIVGPTETAIDAENGIVIMRTKEGVRSRPHSYTDKGTLDLNKLVQDSPSLNRYTDAPDKRKQPKRTHSMPALKHIEMRPGAAKTFLNEQEQRKHMHPKKLRSKRHTQGSINRRKSIDSGTLRKLAEEIHVNPSLEGEYPMISKLLESKFSASERRAQTLYRYKSAEALCSQF